MHIVLFWQKLIPRHSMIHSRTQLIIRNVTFVTPYFFCMALLATNNCNTCVSKNLNSLLSREHYTFRLIVNELLKKRLQYFQPFASSFFCSSNAWTNKQIFLPSRNKETFPRNHNLLVDLQSVLSVSCIHEKIYKDFCLFDITTRYNNLICIAFLL